MSQRRIREKRGDRFCLICKSDLVGVKCNSGKTFSSQYGNAAAHLLRSSLIKSVSTLVMFSETEAWLPCARVCLRWSVVTCTMFFLDCGGAEPF